ncbi:MAG: hypothetical protein WC471_01625 [Candidatus Woesearchaeota archaeon]
MNKKLVYGLIISLIVITLGYYISLYSLLLFGIPSPIDPFGAPPGVSNPNCGESRYEYDATINSKEDFINFLKQNELSEPFKGNVYIYSDLISDFKLNYGNLTEFNSALRSGNLKNNWDKVLNDVKISNVGSRVVYETSYTFFSLECSGHLKMTEDGHVSMVGCCGA